jgi:uncharacterized Tic20 family protein
MMVGPAELILIPIVFGLFVASIVLPIYAAVRAFNNGENGWGIGILIGILVPFGFIIGIVYLMQQRNSY